MPGEEEFRLNEGNFQYILLEMIDKITDQEVESMQAQLHEQGFTGFDGYDENKKKLFIVFDKLTDKEIFFLKNLKVDYLIGMHDFKNDLFAYILYCRSQKKRAI